MKTAIVGMGPHGRRILSVVNTLNNLELAAVVDGNYDVLRDISLSESQKFVNLQSALDANPDVQLLLIATNAPSHASLAIEGMERGVKYVMVEKPMACSVTECDRMISASKKFNVRLAVDKINRFDALFIYIKEKIQSGTWGKLKSIYIQKPGIGLGCLGTHSFDLANFLVNDVPVRVTGWVDEPRTSNPRGNQFIDPGGLVILEYKDGVRAIISQIEEGAGPQTMEINLSGARIIHDPKNNFVDIQERDMSVKPGPGRPPVYRQHKVNSDINIKGDIHFQIKLLISELIGDTHMSADADFGRSAIEILAASYISNVRGNIPVNLPLNKPEDLNLYLPVT